LVFCLSHRFYQKLATSELPSREVRHEQAFSPPHPRPLGVNGKSLRAGFEGIGSAAAAGPGDAFRTLLEPPCDDRDPW
jgi:hypothetical protein